MQSHASPQMSFDYKAKNIFLERNAQEQLSMTSLHSPYNPYRSKGSALKHEIDEEESIQSFRKKNDSQHPPEDIPIEANPFLQIPQTVHNDINTPSNQIIEPATINVDLSDKQDKLKEVWRKNFLIILYFIARFVYLLKIKNKRIRFKFFNKRIFSVFGDMSSHFNYYLDRDYVYQKIDAQQQLLQKIMQNKCVSFAQDQFKKLGKFIGVFQPDSKFKLVWNSLIAQVLIFTLFLMTFEMGFNSNYQDQEISLVFQYVPFILFAIDILFNFNTSYYKQGKIHFQRKQIFIHYINTNILHDIAILVFFVLRYYNILFGIIQIYFLLEKSSQLFENIETEFNLREKRSTILDLTKLIFTIIFVCHFFGCGFHYIGVWEAQNNVATSWLIKYDFINKSTFQQYIGCFYWSTITALTVGYGDYTPQNEIEQLYTIVFILFASMLFGYSISQIGEIFRKMQQNKNELRDQITAINSFLKKKQIDPKLQLQIRKYFEYFFELQIQERWMNQVHFEHLNSHLNEQFKINMYKQKLMNSKLIQTNLSEKCLERLCFQIKETKYTPDDLIFAQGGVNDKIIFVMEGKLQIFCQPSEDNIILLKQIPEGQIICETDLFVPSIKQFSCKSINYSSIATLTYEDFFSTLKSFAYDYEKMMMKKDLISENNYQKIFGESCEVCGGAHLLQKCPFLFEQFQKERIIKKYNSTEDQLRKYSMKRRRKHKQNCITDIDFIQDKAFQFIIKNDEYLELDLEEINVEDLLGLIYRKQESEENLTAQKGDKSVGSLGTFRNSKNDISRQESTKLKDIDASIQFKIDVENQKDQGTKEQNNEKQIKHAIQSGKDTNDAKDKNQQPFERSKSKKESKKFSLNEIIKTTAQNRRMSALANDDDNSEVRQKATELKQDSHIFVQGLTSSNNIANSIHKRVAQKNSMIASIQLVARQSYRNLQAPKSQFRDKDKERDKEKEISSGKFQLRTDQKVEGGQGQGQEDDLIIPQNVNNNKDSLEDFEIMKSFDFYHTGYNVENIIMKLKTMKRRLHNSRTQTIIKRSKTMKKQATIFDMQVEKQNQENQKQ